MLGYLFVSLLILVSYAIYISKSKKSDEEEEEEAKSEVLDAEKEVVEKTAEKTNAVVKLLSAQEKLDIATKKCISPPNLKWMLKKMNWAARPKHKAIAYTPDCKTGDARWGYKSVSAARERALALCSNRRKGKCGIITESFEEFPQPY